MSRSQQNVALLLASLLCFTPVFVWVRIGSPSVSGLSAAARARCGLCDAAELRRGRRAATAGRGCCGARAVGARRCWGNGGFPKIPSSPTYGSFINDHYIQVKSPFSHGYNML